MVCDVLIGILIYELLLYNIISGGGDGIVVGVVYRVLFLYGVLGVVVLNGLNEVDGGMINIMGDFIIYVCLVFVVVV